MPRPNLRFVVLVALVAAGLTIPLATSSGGTTPHVSAAASSCPMTHVPAKPADAVWESAAYQSHYTPTELAAQVVACEVKFHASTAVLAEVALIGLNQTVSKAYQNQNMWLADNSGNLVAQDDFATLGIPKLNLEDGPNGIIYRAPKGQEPTVLPNEMALASSMNPGLAYLYGAALSTQSSALHFMGVQAPDLNLDRIPNWGREMETFGEDPVLAGEMGAAEAEGILKNSPLVVLKHYGIYGQETSRRSINWDVSTQALFNTYLRPFAIATSEVATATNVPAHREVALMCSYGDINGQRSCASHTLTAAEDDLDFSGLVRSDLDTVTTSPALLRAGISLIKPLDAQDFEPTAAISPTNRSLIKNAAELVLATMFAADLVSPSELTASSAVGSLTQANSAVGLSAAFATEEEGAVLLKNGTNGALGDLPLTVAHGRVAVLATAEMSSVCKSLAHWLSVTASIPASCTVWDPAPLPVTYLLHNLAHGTNAHPLSATVTWVAPSSGPYLVNNVTYGDSSVQLNGKALMAQPGIAEIYGPNDVTISAVAGHHYVFKETWEALGPLLTISPLAARVSAAVDAAENAHSALVLADDFTAEGADADELGLPEGQDAVISAVEAAVPTSVALFTTGPVTMSPWLNGTTRSLIEMWNPGGNPPWGTAMSQLVPAYGSLLTGAVSPEGHLPITFPASAAQSPLNSGAGNKQFGYWPGIEGTANLDLAPDNGQVIGYGWYEFAHWPVLFPFGYGLSYATMSTSFDPTAASCATPDSATSICVPVAVRLDAPTTREAATAVEVYVAAPGLTAPTLVLGGAQSVVCRTPMALTGKCTPGVDTDITVTATDIGPWSAAGQKYQLTNGCYTFVVAPDATAAYGEIADPAANPGEVEHATAPFSSATTLTAGRCLG